MNQQDIEQVVKAVLLKMQSSDTPPAAVHEMGVFASLDDAVAAAKVAQQGLKSVAMRQLAIAAIREAGEKHARDLAELAVSETGMGRVEDKFAKNVAQARGTPGVECLSIRKCRTPAWKSKTASWKQTLTGILQNAAM